MHGCPFVRPGHPFRKESIVVGRRSIWLRFFAAFTHMEKEMNAHINSRLYSSVLALSAFVCLGIPGTSAAAPTFSFKNYSTGKCLHSNSSGSVFPWDCTDGNQYQDWYVHSSDGFLAIVQNVKTGRCLTFTNGATTPSTVACGDGTSPRLVWTMMPWFSPEITQKGYGFYHNSSGGRCIYNTPSTVYVGISILDTQISCGTFLSSRWKVIP